MLSAPSHERMSGRESAVSLTLVDTVKTVEDPLCEAESRDELFASTRWTMVLGAGDSAAASAHALSALSELCQIYWRPLYAFLRKQGHGPEDAQDLAQGFFAHVIKTRTYARADREKGRFRSFLLGALKHFIADVRDRGQALKRGGGMILVQLDDNAIAEAERIGKPTPFMTASGRRPFCGAHWIALRKSARWLAKGSFLVT